MMMEERIAEIGNLIRTQDNRITDQPIFIVERQRTEYGYEQGYAEDYKWINYQDDCTEADEEKHSELDEIDSECGDLAGWEKVHYKHYWEFVTACFTEQGCKDYLKRDGHNLGVTRIFAAGSYRNNEWQDVRNLLIQKSIEQEK